jgi:tripartite-type tricarboxylate transporter receptor subunit TctC
MTEQVITRRKLILSAIAGSVCALTRVSHAQSTWPSRALHVVVPFSAGGAADTAIRAYSLPLTEILGQSVVIENRTGGNAVVAASAVLQAPRDGYTFIWDAANCVTNPAMIKDLNFDYEKSFLPITLGMKAPQVIAVRADFPAQNFAEFVEYVRAHPGKVSCGTPPAGGMAHLAVALLEERAKIKLIHTPYRGGADAARDIMGGQIDSVCITASSARGPFKAGKIRILAMTGSSRSALYPEAPTIAESGYPGFDMDDWYALFAAEGVAPEVIVKMQQAMELASKDKRLIESAEQAGQVPVANTTQTFKEWLGVQRPLLQKLIHDGKITAG